MRVRLAIMSLVAVLGLGPSAASAVTQTRSLPSGTMVDLSGFTAGQAIAADDPAFRAAGIASIIVSKTPSTNDEYYDGGEYGAGRALFGTESGDLIVLEEGPSPDFGSPTFTIDFVAPVQSFGLRIADTSEGFATPMIDFFSRGALVGSFVIEGPYNARTEFGFITVESFDRVVINVDTVGTGFGFDGAGITDLTIGRATVPAEPIPVPGSLPLLLAGWLGARRVTRHGRALNRDET
ncbi:MAG: hypothetical protein AAF865_02620 [Pseudomonadota bacterium]